MDVAFPTDSGMAFQMTGDEWQSTQTKCDWHRHRVDYWIAMSKKVGKERLVHEGMPDGQRSGYCN